MAGLGNKEQMAEGIASTEVREEGFYWIVLGQNTTPDAASVAGGGWLAGDAKP